MSNVHLKEQVICKYKATCMFEDKYLDIKDDILQLLKMLI